MDGPRGISGITSREIHKVVSTCIDRHHISIFDTEAVGYQESSIAIVTKCEPLYCVRSSPQPIVSHPGGNLLSIGHYSQTFFTSN